MAGNDATAPILEVLISQHHSEHTSLEPEESRIVRPHPPSYPTVRAVSHAEAEGSKKPDGVVQFRVPTSRETNIHFLESAWLEIPTTPGYDPSEDISTRTVPAILRAFRKLELLTEDKILIETLTPLDILTWTQTTTPDEQYQTLQALGYGEAVPAGSTGKVQLSIPLCVLKDRAPFPLVSLSKTRLVVRVTYASAANMPANLDLRGTRFWFQGLTLPPGQIRQVEEMGLVLPITTFTNQTRVYEKGSAATLESFLLEDTRDLRSIAFVLGNPGETTTTLERFRGDFYKDPLAPDVYRALRECWLDVGSSPTSRPLRPEVVRYISRFGRCARINNSRPASTDSQGEDGLHLLPISTVYRTSRDMYSAPGAMTRSSAKLSLRLRFDPIDRVPGERDRYEVSVVIQRGQRLRIKDGLVDSVDAFHGDEHDGEGGRPHSNPAIGLQEHGVSPVVYGTPGHSEEGIPDEVLGYLTQSPTHEAFSRSTRSVALRGSHRFGETIVADLPLTADLIGDLILRFRLPELPDGYRWINGVGYYALERVVVRHEDAVLYECPGEALFLLNQQDKDLTDRARTDANNYGYRHPGGLDPVVFPTSPTRGSPDGRLRIKIPWSFGTNGYAPLPSAALRHRRIRLEVTLAHVRRLIVPTSADPYDPPTISGSGNGVTGCAISGSILDILPPSLEGGLVITETTADLVGYTIPAELRDQLMSRARLMILRQIRLLRFDNPEGLLRVIPVNHGIRRLLYASPRNSDSVGGERAYDPIVLTQVYAGSTHWYQRIPPEEFFQDWTRLTTGSGLPDVDLYSIDFRPGFLNASRFEELRLQTTPGRLVVVAVSDEPFRVQRGKIGPLFSD
jgi:hypothetical protein